MISESNLYNTAHFDIELRIFILALIGSIASALVFAQDDSALAAAKALDQEILKLHSLPSDARRPAIHALAARVREQPAAYIAALAFNLSVDSGESDGYEVLQDAANTMVKAIRVASPKYPVDDLYLSLAALARYGRVQVTLDDPRYAAALSQVDADDRKRAAAAFKLQDIHGRTWRLSNLRGKVVLVNFWGTYCPPCRREMPDLERLYQRFRNQGLVIVAISGEQSADLRKYFETQAVTFPLLLDPDDKVKRQFLVKGLPKTFLFSREGHLVGQTLDSPDSEGWLALLSLAGLH